MSIFRRPEAPRLAVLVAGVGFKLSLVPFHAWTPQAYSTADLGTATFLATASKLAAAAALFVVVRALAGAGGTQVLLPLAVPTYIIAFAYPSSLSPGVEQVARWGSAARDLAGSWNFAGAANPAADAMIDTLLKARDRDAFVQAVRAYDRVLMSGSYVVPLKVWVRRDEGIELGQHLDVRLAVTV